MADNWMDRVGEVQERIVNESVKKGNRDLPNAEKKIL